MVEGSAVQRILVMEVVIEECLVDLRGLGNRVGTRAGNAFAGELADGGLQDGGAALLGLSS